MKYILFLWGVAVGLAVILVFGIPRSPLPESLRLIRSALPNIEAGTALCLSRPFSCAALAFEKKCFGVPPRK